MYNWLAADLAANQDKAIFVFGHKPAFPENRHTTDSLNAHSANRDGFWALLGLGTLALIRRRRKR